MDLFFFGFLLEGLLWFSLLEKNRAQFIHIKEEGTFGFSRFLENLIKLHSKCGKMFKQ